MGVFCRDREKQYRPVYRSFPDGLKQQTISVNIPSDCVNHVIRQAQPLERIPFPLRQIAVDIDGGAGLQFLTVNLR